MKRQRCFALVIIAAMLWGPVAHAAVTWDGGASTLNWGDGANWNPDGVPPSGSQIQFNGVEAGSAQVAAGSTVSLSGVGIYGVAATEIDLKNGAGFTIDVTPATDYTYWRILKVQDANAYTIESQAYGPLTIFGTTTADVASGGTLTVDGGFTVSSFGTGELKKTGGGTMYLTGGRPPNPSIVHQTVQGGMLSVASVDDLGTGWVAAQLGGTIQYTGTGSESKTGLLYWNNGSGTIDVSSPTANLTFNVTGGDWGSAGGTFTKTGPGTLTVATSGVDINLNKPVAVNNGTLALQANGSNIIRIQTAVTGAAGTTIRVLANSTAGTGTVRNDSLVANWTSNLAGLDVAGGGTFDLRGDDVTVDALTGAGSIINSYYSDELLTLGVNGGSGTFSGTISGTGTTGGTPGQVSLLKVGAGTQTLSGTNNSTGYITIRGGVLSVPSVNSLFSSWVAMQQGGTLQYTGTGSESKTGLLYWNSGSGTIDVASPTANLTFNVTGGDWGSAGGTFTKTGPGTLTLATSGTSIILGKPIALNQGTVALQTNGGNLIQIITTVTGAAGTMIDILPGSGTVRNDNLWANWTSNLAGLNVHGGGTFDLRGNNVTVDALTGAGSIINSYYQANSGIVGHTLTLGANGGSGTFSGTISGTGTTDGTPGQVSLLKVGTGTQTLTGTNTYTGTTTVVAGTLLVDGTLHGDVDVQPGGTISAGSSPGHMIITDSSSYTQTGTMLVELGGLLPGSDYDWIEVDGGDADVAGLLDILLVDSFQPATGATFDVLTATGGVTDSGITLDWNPAQLLPAQYWKYSIEDLLSGGQALRLEVGVPEPSTFALAALGLLGLALAGWRRRRRS